MRIGDIVAVCKAQMSQGCVVDDMRKGLMCDVRFIENQRCEWGKGTKIRA